MHPSRYLLLASVVFAATAAAPALGETVVRFAHMNSPQHFVDIEGRAMAARIAERTGGEVQIEMFPSGQLGETSQIVEQITYGGDMMSQVGPGSIADYVPDFSVIVYPFMYPDYAAAQRLLVSDLVQELEAQARDVNVQVLCYIHFGIRDLYTIATPVRSPADSAGLKMRVQPVTLYTEMVRQVFDAEPTPMPWPDVYTALSQGVIDAAEAPPSAIIDQRHHESARYLVQTNHILDISPIVMSASAYDGLSAEHQAIVDEESQAGCDAMSAASIASYEQGIETLREAGMEIISDVDREAFAERAGGIAASFPEWSDGLYERARAIVLEQ